MKRNDNSFDKLIKDALQQDFSGWDFSYLNGRWHDSSPSWDYRKAVFEKSRCVNSLLDLGTGGGEFLSSLVPFPPVTFATESYTPNVPLAAKKLTPLGCQIIKYSHEALPFSDNKFDLVINRHESIPYTEVFRVMKPGGEFITQQVGGLHNVWLNHYFQGDSYKESDFNLRNVCNELKNSGFIITESGEDFPELRFCDIGAIVYYLKVISWQIEHFSVEKYHSKLLELHDRIKNEGGLCINSHYFYIYAKKEKLK